MYLIDKQHLHTPTNLYHTSPVVIDPMLIAALGSTNAAIIVQHLHYKLVANKHNIEYEKIDQHTYSAGRVWACITVEDLHRQLFYIPKTTVTRCISHLISMGVILEGVANHKPQSITKWYTLDYNRIHTLTDNARAQFLSRVATVKSTTTTATKHTGNSSAVEELLNSIFK